jgi:hypothetical protein
MSIYVCINCNKNFKFNSLLLKHKNNKKPCKPKINNTETNNTETETNNIEIETNNITETETETNNTETETNNTETETNNTETETNNTELNNLDSNNSNSSNSNGIRNILENTNNISNNDLICKISQDIMKQTDISTIEKVKLIKKTLIAIVDKIFRDDEIKLILENTEQEIKNKPDVKKNLKERVDARIKVKHKRIYEFNHNPSINNTETQQNTNEDKNLYNIRKIAEDKNTAAKLQTINML